ncbi:STAS domain-containing protein [bacterium]|nr:STAS domain-containing protein [bacterium]
MKAKFEFYINEVKEKKGNYFVANLVGSSSGTSIELKQYKDLQAQFLKLVKKDSSGFIFNFTDLEYATSSLIGAVIRCYKSTLQKEVPFVIYGLREEPKEVFEILGCAEYIPIYETYKEAVEHLSS